VSPDAPSKSLGQTRGPFREWRVAMWLVLGLTKPALQLLTRADSRKSPTISDHKPLCRVIRQTSRSHPRVLALRFLVRSSIFGIMATEPERDVVQLAEQVAEGFAALSGEYQILFDQQKQLESKLSWAKQQVSHVRSSSVLFLVMNTLALDLQLLCSSDRQQPCIPDLDLISASYVPAF
jgi:hypothetical protein